MHRSTSAVAGISDAERLTRVTNLRHAMANEGITATLLGSTESLRYLRDCLAFKRTACGCRDYRRRDPLHSARL